MPARTCKGETAVTSLLPRLPDQQLAVPSGELRWGHADDLVLRGPAGLPVILGKEQLR